jgi:hypothetical protein
MKIVIYNLLDLPESKIIETTDKDVNDGIKGYYNLY